MKKLKIKKLPKPAKISGSKSLREIGFSVREIAEILGISKSAVHRYLKETTDKEWDEWGRQIKKIVSIKEEEVAAKTLKLIEEKMPRARFYELVGLYKTIRELRQPKTSILQQFNIQPILGGKSRDADNDRSQQDSSSR